QADESLDSDLELPESSFDGLDGDLAQADAEAEPVAPVTAQTADVLGEADIYIAYGRFNQAAELLQNAVNDEPQRSDLRLKLMEVQAELGDRDGFARQERELREIGGVNADLEQINAKYPAMAAAAVVGAAALNMDDELDAFNLDDLDLDEPAVQPAAEDLDDAFDLSLDELDVGLDDNLDAAGAHKASDEFAELSLDGDFDLPELAAASVAVEDDLGFDLDLDMDMPAAAPELSLESADDLADFSLDLESDTPVAAESEEDFLLDLEDEPAAPAVADELVELSLELPGEEGASEFDLPADFDLSLAEEEPVAASPDSFAAQLDEVTAQLDDLAVNLQQTEDDNLLDLEAPALGDSLATGLDGDDDFDFLSGTDEAATKLDLARAYIDMGDTEGARDILDEVVAEGNDTQQQEARELLAGLT
ncbi:MAG: peptigoglycan-binding protein LysM, partial [Pseudomonadaceae bacterium]|nr:peptigoglycan-binding protein LysM [Pseudomonadaceae bacterium]